MMIRNFQSGDEEAQAAIYNDATAALPKFKPASVDEVRRRCRAPEFDPNTRFFAIEDNQPVAYATFHPNGRVNYPWCRPGCERATEPLWEHVLQAMRQRGMKKTFAAYRADWTAQRDFFLGHGFRQAREMVNFWLEPTDMPTPAARRSYPIAPARPEDVPAILQLAPQLLRVHTPAELQRHLFQNPYFPPEAVFVARNKADSAILAAGVLISAADYADPRQVDANMPCFRLGAFGTEGMQTKRINGLFSFLAQEGNELNRVALDLMGHAAFRLHYTDVPTFAAQVPSDMPHLFRFYQHHFRRQGSFPVYERDLETSGPV
ncbi:MAG TPA: hypothetical protein VKU02_12190 [Gemmataceae bacterium]|nr:hypothetical protein [Gemmataceae bacterium]